MSLVSFVQIKDSNFSRAIEASLDLINYEFPKNIKKVVIKPNLCYYWDYSTGQTTDPKIVAALIELLRGKISQDLNISIVESDASAMKCKYSFKFLGYEKLAKKHYVKLVNLSEDKGEKVTVTVQGENFEFTMPETIKNADLRINVPKIKYMSYTKISCALKNIFGCNPNPKKFRYHPKIDETIVALNKIMKFDLHILDGLIVAGSHPTKLDLVMASQDPVALDTAAAKIAGVNPRTVRHIKLAHKEGLGNITYIPKGENPETFARKFPKKKLKHKILASAYKIATKTHLLDTELL
ncbi:MAG: DUF362 domain-containing protein [Candidatus Bathyarchaeia archaeon]